MGFRKARNSKVDNLRNYMTIVVGSVIMAVAVNLIFEPLGLVTGGLAGLAIVVKELTKFIWEGGLPVWIFTVITNIPLFLVSIKLLGIKAMFSVSLGTITYVLALAVIPIYDFQFNDMLLAAVVGGYNRSRFGYGIFRIISTGGLIFWPL